MQTFKDRNGKNLTIDINYGELQRLRKKLGVDLLTIIQDPEAAASLADDDMKMVEVIQFLCGVPDNDDEVMAFYDALDGDVIENAWSAVVEDLINFFPKKKRPVLKKLRTTAERIEKKTVEQLLEKLDEMEPETLMDLIERSETEKTSDESASDSQELSESIQLHSP